MLEDLLATVLPRREQLEKLMASPEAIASQQRMKELAREYRRVEEISRTGELFKRARADVEELREALDDPELAPLATQELPAAEARFAETERRLRLLLVPEEPEDARNAVLEIRAGTGGEEASLFAADLYRMYQYYCELSRWKMQVVTSHFSDLGGIRELAMEVTGDGAYGTLKFESGVHRVQRVPTTEASGRIHTSAATVAVLPEAEEVDVEIDPADLKIDTYRASGPGGQHVNKTDSAIRLTHIPTGIVVTCQDERSQHKNKSQAMRLLRSKLFQMALEEKEAKRAAQRRSQVSTGDRSAKIRTYNFPQNRVTDHRVPVTVHRLDEILEGKLDYILEPLADYFAALKLEALFREADAKGR